MTFNILPQQKGLKTAFWQAARHDGGIAATEFAMILPFLLLILMGVIELSNAMTAKRKLLNAVQSASDLIGQNTDVTSTDLDSIYLAAALTMDPLDTSSLTIGVSSVRFDDTTGAPAEDWTDSYNGGTVYLPLDKATGRGEAGASIVIVTGTYTYQPLIKLIIPASFTLNEIAYVRPRKVSYIMKF